MNMPPANSAPETLLDSYGEYLSARLGAKKELKDLAAFFGARQDALRKKLDTCKALDRAIQHVMAARDDADFTLDDTVRQFSFAILSGNNSNRKAPAYLKYFPQGLTAVTLAPLPEEVLAVSKMLDLLGSEENVQFKGFEELLRSGLDGLKNAMAAFKGAVDAADSSQNAVRAEGIEWRDGYRKVYGELIARYPSNRAYVESFFKKPPPPKKGSGGDGSGGTAEGKGKG